MCTLLLRTGSHPDNLLTLLCYGDMRYLNGDVRYLNGDVYYPNVTLVATHDITLSFSVSVYFRAVWVLSQILSFIPNMFRQVIKLYRKNNISL